MARQRLLKLARALAMTVMLGGFAGFFYGAGVWYDYYDTLPRSPQPATGRTCRMNMHGVAVYASRRERRLLALWENVPFIVFVAGGVAPTLMDPKFRRKVGWRSLEEPRARPSGSPEPPAG